MGQGWGRLPTRDECRGAVPLCLLSAAGCPAAVWTHPGGGVGARVPWGESRPLGRAPGSRARTLSYPQGGGGDRRAEPRVSFEGTAQPAAALGDSVLAPADQARHGVGSPQPPQPYLSPVSKKSAPTSMSKPGLGHPRAAAHCNYGVPCTASHRHCPQGLGGCTLSVSPWLPPPCAAPAPLPAGSGLLPVCKWLRKHPSCWGERLGGAEPPTHPWTPEASQLPLLRLRGGCVYHGRVRRVRGGVPVLQRSEPPHLSPAFALLSSCSFKLPGMFSGCFDLQSRGFSSRWI